MGMRAAAVKIVPVLALIVIPVIAYVVMFDIAWRTDTLAIDFHNEIYPEAKELLRGQDPFPSPTADLTRGSNHIWPPLAAYAAAPLTLLSPAAADVVMVVLGIVCFGAALWVVGVRDWRVYGAASLWASVIGEMRTAHLSLILCLFVAIVWRTRSRTAIPGLTLGFAVGLKFFLWPLDPMARVHAQMARGRDRCSDSPPRPCSSSFLTSRSSSTRRILRRLGGDFDQDGFSAYGVLVQAGAPNGLARVVSLAICLALLAVAWRRRSFALFIAAALAAVADRLARLFRADRHPTCRRPSDVLVDLARPDPGVGRALLGRRDRRCDARRSGCWRCLQLSSGTRSVASVGSRSAPLCGQSDGSRASGGFATTGEPPGGVTSSE